MARSLYAGRPGDSVVSLFDIGDRQLLALPTDANGDTASVTLTVWDEPDGTQLTDLLAADGTTPITEVTVPVAARGQIPEFYSPDGYNVAVYIRDPDGDYFRLDARSDVVAEAAIAAAAAAEAAAAAAEAVGATSDAQVAANVETGPLTGAALSASTEELVAEQIVDEDSVIGNAASVTFIPQARRPINLRDYAGAGQGDTTIDTAAYLDALVGAHATGRSVHIPDGEWNWNAGGLIAASNIRIAGAGSDATEVILHGSFNPIKFAGTVPVKASPTTTLASNATVTDGAASNTIVVTSAAGLAVGDIILIGDNYTIPGAATINASWALRERGELQKIRAIAGTTITLEGALRDDYTTARGASVYKLAPIYGNGLAGMTFRNATPEATTYNRMAQFWACANMSVEDVSFKDGDFTGLSLDYVFNAEVHEASGEGFADNIGLGMGGYIINVGPAEDVRIFGGKFGRARHGITTDGWEGHRGWPRNVKVTGTQATGTTAAAFDTHPWGSDIEFIDCTAHSCYLPFQIRTKRTKVINGGSERGQAGDVFIYGGTATDVEVLGGVYRHGLAEGVAFTGSVDLGYPARVTVKNSVFEDTWGRAVRMAVPVDDLLVQEVTAIRPSRVLPTGVGNGAILVDDGIAPARFKAIRNVSIGGNCVVNIGGSVTGARVIGNHGYELVGSGAAAVRGTGTGTASNRLRDNYDFTADLTFSDSEYFIANSRARFGYDTNSVIIDDNGGTAREILFRSGGSVRLRLGTAGMVRINEGGVGGGAGSLIAMPNVTTPPTSNPTGGGVVWFEGGAMRYRTAAGTHQTVAGDVVAKSANYALTVSDKTCLATGGVSGITITLPTAVGNNNEYVIKKVDAGAGSVTIATTSSQTIDGATTKVLTTQYAYRRVVSDGTAWHIIADG